jgi:hypothetical protein
MLTCILALNDTAKVNEELGGIDGVELHEWPGARVCPELLLIDAKQAEVALEKEREGRESEEREQREGGEEREEGA